jgi:type I restriction enzyme M protein
VPKPLIVARYFAKEQARIDHLNADLETATAALTELDEEHGGEEGALRYVSNKSEAQAAWGEAIEAAWKELLPESFASYERSRSLLDAAWRTVAETQELPMLQSLKNARGTITKTAVNKRMKETDNAEEKNCLKGYLEMLENGAEAEKLMTGSREAAEEELRRRLESNSDDPALADLRVIGEYLRLTEQIADLKRRIKDADAEIDEKAYAKYPELTEDEIKTLVVDDKWLAAIDRDVHGEMERISQSLTQRVKELAERYESPLPELSSRISEMEEKVGGHLERMGFDATAPRLLAAGT